MGERRYFWSACFRSAFGGREEWQNNPEPFKTREDALRSMQTAARFRSDYRNQTLARYQIREGVTGVAAERFCRAM